MGMLALAKQYLAPWKRSLILGPATKTLEVVFDLLVPLIVAYMIDQGVAADNTSVVLQGGLALVLMAVFGFASTLVCQKMASVASQGVGTSLRHALYAQVASFDFATLDAFGTASLTTRLTSDVNAVQLAVAMLIRQVIRWPVLAVGSLICALALDFQLGLIFCVCMPAVALIFYAIMRRSIPYFRAMQQKLDGLGHLVRERILGARPIRAFNRESFEERRFQAASTDQAETATRVSKLQAALTPATFVVMNAGVVALLLLGGQQVGIGRLETGQVMAMIGYMNQLLVSIVFVANLVVIFTRAYASSERIAAVLEAKPIVTSPKTPALTPVPGAPAFELRDVSLTYAGAQGPALDGVTITLEPGQTLGIIGGTGSGKSTLVNLMARFYDPTRGTIRLFGHPLSDYSFEQLRSLISLVPQTPALLSGTIRSNLIWREKLATDAELMAALDAAQAGDFVRALPDGLDGPVEAKGANFSGGQRQRLTIARALVGAPSVLILDDASSALDAATDKALRKALATLPYQPTKILVSQRVSTVAGADLIAVIDAGEMVALGTHAELLATSPLYQEICATQAKVEAEVA